jgi:hypothetical protein
MQVGTVDKELFAIGAVRHGTPFTVTGVPYEVAAPGGHAGPLLTVDLSAPLRARQFQISTTLI